MSVFFNPPPVDSAYMVTLSLVAEPATWTLVLVGAGMLGAGLRAARSRVAPAVRT